ncbi:MAG: hypothetical protein U1E49_02530 [Hyphomicrobiaceae bacterium]
MNRLSGVVAALVLALVWIVPTIASADEWVSLGRQKASPGIDRDVINLNRNEGPYTAIKLKVTSNVVTLFNVKVVFNDGTEQALPVSNLTIRPGEETVPLDLAGRRRGITRVELLYGGNLTALLKRPEIEVLALKVAERDLPPLGREWSLLGQGTVDMARDRDVIRVGGEQGLFNGLILRVKGGDVNLRELRVIYADGEGDLYRVRQLLPAGSETEAIDLRGESRGIRQVELVYDTARRGRGRATVEVWGREAPERELPPLGREWSLLGQQRVDMARDRDVIRVGRDDGRYNAIVVRVKGGPVNLRNLRIVYGNGEADDLGFDRPLSGGEETRPIDIKGRFRFIDRIELTYDRERGAVRLPVVEVWARQAPEPELPPLGREWQSLGETSVAQDSDRAEIEVGREAGRVNAIILRARRNDVRLRALTVVYANGEEQELAVDGPLYAGEETQIVELKGRPRPIDRIELRLRAMGRGDRPAQIEAWGRQAPEPELPPLGRDWQLVGKPAIDGDAERIVVEADRELGRLNGLLLRVRRGDLRMRGMTITYANGEEEQVAFDNPIYGGEDSTIIDLKGRPRTIERIELRIRPSLRERRRAELEIWGRKAPEPVPPPLPREWQLVGKQELDPGRDRASIDTALEAGRFNAVLIRVRRDDLRLRGLTVSYGDGETEDFDIDDTVFAGDEGVTIEIKGRPRFIERVDLKYRSGARGGPRRPEVEIWARQAPERELPPLGREWQLLGKQTVDLGRDRQIVDVGDDGGRMSALVLRARRDDIRLRRLKLVYANGEEEEVPVDSVVYAGEETSVIELKGRPRFIQSIEVVTRALGRSGRRAELEIWGRIAPEPTPPPLPKEWSLLGKQTFDPGDETGSVEIGAEDRRYDGLIVRVRRSDLRATGLQIVYGNGERDEVDLNEAILAGEDSPIIELKGRPRLIDRIEITYRSGGRRVRPSEVEIWGRASREPELPRLDQSWVLLDKNRVDMGRDRDVFEVNAIGGRIDQLLIRARGNDIDLRRAKLIYQSGETEEIDIGQRLYAGEQTTPVQLKGRARFVQAVEMSYRAVDRSGRPAEVELWGHVAKDEPFGEGWRKVDALPVDRRGDKVVYELSRRDGRVRAVGVRANGGSVHLTGIAMMYGNGDKDAKPLDDRLRPDGTTRPIDVTGFRRAFERIEVYYERSPSIDSRTQLELWVRE